MRCEDQILLSQTYDRFVCNVTVMGGTEPGFGITKVEWMSCIIPTQVMGENEVDSSLYLNFHF